MEAYMKRSRLDNKKLIAAEAGMKAVEQGVGIQMLVGVGAQMILDKKKDYMVEVHGKNNKWGMEEGWYEVGELLRWVACNMIVK